MSENRFPTQQSIDLCTPSQPQTPLEENLRTNHDMVSPDPRRQDMEMTHSSAQNTPPKIKQSLEVGGAFNSSPKLTPRSVQMRRQWISSPVFSQGSIRFSQKSCRSNGRHPALQIITCTCAKVAADANSRNAINSQTSHRKCSCKFVNLSCLMAGLTTPPLSSSTLLQSAALSKEGFSIAAFCSIAIITNACWGGERDVLLFDNGPEEPTSIVHKVCGRKLLQPENEEADQIEVLRCSCVFLGLLVSFFILIFHTYNPPLKGRFTNLLATTCSFCGVECEQERDKELQFDKLVLTLDDGSDAVRAVCLPDLVPSLLGVSPLFYEQLEIEVMQPDSSDSSSFPDQIIINPIPFSFLFHEMCFFIS